jgi:1,2-diacylglycerol 3-beta-glucosyltransferase
MWDAAYAAVTLTTVLAFTCYVALIASAFLRRQRHADGETSQCEWHLFIPCRDEEAVIARTMEEARTHFPAAHVWIIDDASTDSTAAIVESRMRLDTRVHLVARTLPDARTGKGAALNAAYRDLIAWRTRLASPTSSHRVIVGVVDADGRLAPNALAAIAGRAAFGRDEVGAAQITVHMHNLHDEFRDLPRHRRLWKRWLITMQDLEFRTIVAGMQSLRARTGTVGMGGNGQFSRLQVLEELEHEFGAPWHGSLLEDYEMGLHVLLRGWESAHVHSTHVSQEAVEDLPRLLTQRTRWAQGNIQCLLYLPRVRKSVHVSSSGVLETAYYLLLPYTQIIVICFWLVQFTGYVVSMLTHGVSPISDASGLLTRLSMLLVGIVPFAIWGPIYRAECEPRLGHAAAVGLGLLVFVYTSYVIITTPRAMIRAWRGQTNWSKTRRNAENLMIGGVAREI